MVRAVARVAVAVLLCSSVAAQQPTAERRVAQGGRNNGRDRGGGLG